MNPNAHRTPSPGHPLQYGYQLDDNPYQHADMPVSHDGRYTPADSIEMHQAVGTVWTGHCVRRSLVDVKTALDRKSGWSPLRSERALPGLLCHARSPS